MRKKSKALVVAMCALVLALGVNATLAWLTDKTDEVENTFTVGDINITLQEHKLQSDGALGNETVTANSYDIVPGATYPKDPFVTVKADSEECWLFVEVTETNNVFGQDKFIKWVISNEDLIPSLEGMQGWTLVDGTENVYWVKVPATSEDTYFYILDENMVNVNADITKTEVVSLQAAKPSLSFTAYAIQADSLKDNSGSEVVGAQAAWALVKPAQNA